MLYYLGLKVKLWRKVSSFLKKAMQKRFLKKFKMFDYNLVNTPMESEIKLSKFEDGVKENPIFVKKPRWKFEILNMYKVQFFLSSRSSITINGDEYSLSDVML